MHESVASFRVSKTLSLLALSGLLLFASVAFADIVAGLSTTNVSNDVAYTELTLSKPSGSTTGDLLLANVSVNGGNGAGITAPTGWTLIGKTDNDANIGIASYWKILGSSEPPTYTWTISPQTRAVGGITRYSGVNSSNPIDAMGSTTGRGTVATAPAITTTQVNDRVIALFAINAGKDNAPLFSTSTGMTKQYERKNTPFGPTTAAEDITQAAAGSSGTADSTVSSGAQRDWAAQHIALRMAPTTFTLASTSVWDTAGTFTWTAPTSTVKIEIVCWGAGGGGTGGNNSAGSGGGAYIASTTITSGAISGNTTLIVGQGGQGGQGTTGGTGGTGYASGGNGSNGATWGGGGGGGGSSAFGTYCIASGSGGSGAGNGDPASGSSGGVGGVGQNGGTAGGGGGSAASGGNASGTTGGTAGTGGTTQTGTNGTGSSGGGSPAGLSGNGINSVSANGANGSGGAAGGTSGTPNGANGTGFDSGGGGYGGSGNGGNGGIPGGGGGAAQNTLGAIGGNGGAGRIIIYTYTAQ